jgi:small conductance mechanosensitive channel
MRTMNPTRRLAMSDKTVETLVNIGIALGIVLVGYIVIRILCSITRKALNRSKLDEVLHTYIVNCIRIVLWILVAFTALSYAGIPITAFLTALGAAGVAVALALKDSLGNFAGGILIILTKPFKKRRLYRRLSNRRTGLIKSTCSTPR